MAFVADALKQFHRRMIQPQPERFAFARQVNLLKLLSQPDDENFFQAEFCQFSASGVQLALAAVYQDQVGKIRYLGGPACRRP